MKDDHVKKEAVMKRIAHLRVAAAALLIAGLTSCSGMNSTQQRVLSGAAIGAGGGALVGAATGGNAGTGALIGAGAGAVGGYIVDQNSRD
jgi:hypothetical protein